jgi:hypothetical protein
MSTKNPDDVGQANAKKEPCSLLIQLADERLAVERLVEHSVSDFRELAKVPKPGAIPDSLELEVHEIFHELFDDWTHLLNEERVPPPGIVELFDTIRRDAVALQQQLEKLHSTLEDKTTLHPTENDTLPFAIDSMSLIVIKGIDRVKDALALPLDRALESGKRRGRPPTRPSLEFFVTEMERLALTFGGKGFGTPSTRPQKGRIIQMLDRLRKHLIDDPRLSWLADFLPPPGTHPVSVYQRAIKRGRAEYAEELERSQEYSFGDTSENCES